MTEHMTPQTPEHTGGGSPEVGAPNKNQRVNKRSRRAQLIIASITAGLLLFVAADTALEWPRVETGAAADIPTNEISGWLDAQDRSTNSYTVAWEKEMNEALQSGDKDAFLAHAEGQAKELLGFWWDGTREVGWDYAFVFRTIGENNTEFLNLGMKLDFTAQVPRSSGREDAGLELTQQFAYALTLEGEDNDDAIITGLVPRQPMPWDEGPIYVQKRDRVVLFAAADEQALVDANIDLAQESAEDTFAMLDQIGGQTPTQGFTTTITDDQERFDAWSGSLEELKEFEVAGFAAATQRPHRRTEFMPVEIATGNYSSGSWIGMGPKSADRRKAVFVHEYAHALHESALPYNYMSFTDPAPVEGFAQYLEELQSSNGNYVMRPDVKAKILEVGDALMAPDALEGPEAFFGYTAASSYFHFVEAAGGSTWQLAMDRDEGLTMSQRARIQGPQFGAEQWIEWVRQQ